MNDKSMVKRDIVIIGGGPAMAERVRRLTTLPRR